MKLRNKKNGKIFDVGEEVFIEINYCAIEVRYVINDDYDCATAKYETLSQFCADWEDYNPPEPLIKDPKIRKAVRAWAEVVGEETFVVSYNAGYHDCCVYIAGLSSTAMIDLGTDLEVKEGSYTLAELCGEEKK